MVIVSLSPRQWAHELTARYIDTNETTIVVVRDFEVLRDRILELLNQIRVQFQVFPPLIKKGCNSATPHSYTR